ncbi:MAG: class I SAM-dependent methyltransferase [Planctomycetota bacterium]|nr:class I SAM-dependent methyltransferase [Planctomycetota bacterium]
MSSDEFEMKHVLQPDWCTRPYWEAHYKNLFTNPEEPRSSVYRRFYIMTRELPRLKAWGLKRVLDAGCGITLLPYILQYAGFQVTAVDISAQAIAYLKDLRPDEAALSKCLVILNKDPQFEAPLPWSPIPLASWIA